MSRVSSLTGEAAGADHIARQVGEEAFDKIEPGRGGRREMHLEARPLVRPRAHLRMLVGGVIVGDQMQIDAARRLAIDLLEEAQPFEGEYASPRCA